jgi:hypothetical protein
MRTLMKLFLHTFVFSVLACMPSFGDAQDTVDELLEMATPRWLSAREKGYNNSGIRMEQMREDRDAKTGVVKRSRQSRDLYSAGDVKLISVVVKNSDTPLDKSEPFEANDQVLSKRVTAQNAKYGFVVDQDHRIAERHGLWQVKDQVVWQQEIEWMWLPNPLPSVAPIESTIMRGLALDPRLCVSNTYTPLETIFQQLQDQGEVKQITRRDSGELGGIVVVNWTNEVDKIDPSFATQGAVKTRVTVQVELLPEHEWRLLFYKMRFEYLDVNEKSIGVHARSTKIDYSPGSTTEPYRITVSEDSTRGEFQTIREVRPLTQTEKDSLSELCYLSGFQIPEPEGLPADSSWWQYLVGLTAVGILASLGIRWYRNRSFAS